MRDFFDANVRELDPDTLMVIVVGAHLEAEVTDRALGYRLRERILDWQTRNPVLAAPAPVVCSDLWYLNHPPLRVRPAIAVGAPEVNAATAFLAGRLPTALIVDERLRIQIDPELLDLQACVWGARPAFTAEAVELFAERYLPEFLECASELGEAA